MITAIKCFIFLGCVKQDSGLYSYQKILDSQFACDEREFKDLRLDPRDKWLLATEAVHIISDMKVSVAPPPTDEVKDCLNYIVEFRGWAQIECGEDAYFTDNLCGDLIHESRYVCSSGNDNQYIEIGDEGYSPLELGWMTFIRSGTIGLTCLINKNELLKNTNEIELDKICEGKSEVDRNKTREQIDRAITKWKYAGCPK